MPVRLVVSLRRFSMARAGTGRRYIHKGYLKYEISFEV